VIVEAALLLCGVDYVREEVDYEKPSPARDRLLALNPLGQVPTLVLPDGTVMTETAAIALYLEGEYPKARLLPPVGDPLRPFALRWLLFCVTAIYPTFTYGDQPTKWVTDGDALRRSTDEHRERLWRQLESAARGPCFLGDRRSILDVYVTVMTRWRPRRDWFALHAPKLHAIATAVDADPRLVPLWAANFPL
jgi:GST-like protein